MGVSMGACRYVTRQQLHQWVVAAPSSWNLYADHPSQTRPGTHAHMCLPVYALQGSNHHTVM
jgi:thioesterase domain-containing protein